MVGAALCLFAPLQGQEKPKDPPAKEPAKEQPAKEQPAKEPGKVDLDKALAGNWKITLALPRAQKPVTLWLVKFNKKDNAWSPELLATAEGLRESDPAEAKFSEFAIKDGVLSFNIKMGDLKIEVEGKVDEGDTGKILASALLQGQQLVAAKLERTTMTTLNDADLAREIIATKTDALELIPAVMQLVGSAEKIKAKPEEVRGWMDKALKASEAHGIRYHRSTLLDLVELLNGQEGFAKVALPYARRAERTLTPKDKPAVQERTLKLLAAALEGAGEKEEAKTVQARMAKIDQSVQGEPITRTGKSDRVAVVELFTGAECPPCVAADMAFDGLIKAFKPKDVVLLQYHQHIPGPDPLTNKDSEARMKYYAVAFGRQVRGTPTVMFNGEPQAPGGGRKADAQDKYDQYVGVIKPLLEKDSRAKLTATATQKGDSIEIKAEVADLKDAGESTKLRFVLIEDKVSYKGGNGIPEHHHIVRAMPGGVEGVALKDKAYKGGATVDLGVLKKDLQKYLADYYKEAGEEVPKETPMELKDLRVVALIQDDNTREIIQAVQVNVEAAK